MRFRSSFDDTLKFDIDYDNTESALQKYDFHGKHARFRNIIACIILFYDFLVPMFPQYMNQWHILGNTEIIYPWLKAMDLSY